MCILVFFWMWNYVEPATTSKPFCLPRAAEQCTLQRANPTGSILVGYNSIYRV